MTVLGTLAKRANINNAQVPLTSTALADWLGMGQRSSSGVTVNETKVMGIPAYYRGCAIVAGTLAAMPLKVYKNGTRIPVAQRTVVQYPNPRQTAFEFWQTMYLNAITWGDMFAHKIRDGANIVQQVWPIHPSCVQVEEVSRTDSNPEGKVFHVRQTDGTTKTLTSWDIFHAPYMSVDGIKGIRPLQVFRESLGTGIATEQTAGKLLGDGLRIQGILSTEQKLDPERADALKKRWRERTTGPGAVGDIAILDNGMKFDPIVLPPADAQLLESRQWTIAEISRMVGVQPFMLGETEKTTTWGSGVEQMVLGVIKFGFGHWIELVEQRVTYDLLPGGWRHGSWFAEYSLESLLRGDSKTRAEFYRVMVNMGVYTLNEVRKFENEEPVDGLDVFLLPKNMTVFDPSSGGSAADAAVAATAKPAASSTPTA